MYSVELITDNRAFLALENPWNEAVQRARIPHPFLRHEWIRTWWDAFGGGHRLHILAVRRAAQLVAIAPLMFEQAEMYRVPVRKLRLFFNDYTPRADVIVDANPSMRNDAYRALWHALVDGHMEWDVIQFGQLPGDSSTRATFTKFADAEHRARGIWESGASPYVNVAGTWDAYYRTLSPKFRQNVRNRLARLSRFGVPALEIVQDPLPMHAAMADVERLEDSGWKGSEGTSIASNADVRRFYALLVARAVQCPWLRLMFLTIDGRRIAAAIAAEYGGRLFLLKTGYDPEFAACSPFKVFMYFAMKHAFDSGLQEVDLLGDPEPWKLEWTSTTRRHEWLFLFSETRRARLLHPLKFQFLPALRRLQHSASCLSPLFRA